MQLWIPSRRRQGPTTPSSCLLLVAAAAAALGTAAACSDDANPASPSALSSPAAPSSGGPLARTPSSPPPAGRATLQPVTSAGDVVDTVAPGDARYGPNAYDFFAHMDSGMLHVALVEDAMSTMRTASQPHRMRQVEVYHVISEPRHVLQTHGEPLYTGTVQLSGRLELPPIAVESCAPHEWIVVQAAELSDDRYDGWRNAPCPQPGGVVVGSDGSGPGWERSEHGAPARDFPPEPEPDPAPDPAPSPDPSPTPTPDPPTGAPAPPAPPTDRPVDLGRPVPVAPVDGQEVASTRPTLLVENPRVTGYDGAVRLRFEVSSTRDFSAVAASAAGPVSGSSQTRLKINAELDPGASYFWRARALTTTDPVHLGGWSDLARFRVRSLADPDPTPTPTPTPTPLSRVLLASGLFTTSEGTTSFPLLSITEDSPSWANTPGSYTVEVTASGRTPAITATNAQWRVEVLAEDGEVLSNAVCRLVGESILRITWMNNGVSQTDEISLSAAIWSAGVFRLTVPARSGQGIWEVEPTDTFLPHSVRIFLEDL